MNKYTNIIRNLVEANKVIDIGQNTPGSPKRAGRRAAVALTKYSKGKPSDFYKPGGAMDKLVRKQKSQHERRMAWINSDGEDEDDDLKRDGEDEEHLKKYESVRTFKTLLHDLSEMKKVKNKSK